MKDVVQHFCGNLTDFGALDLILSGRARFDYATNQNHGSIRM